MLKYENNATIHESTFKASLIFFLKPYWVRAKHFWFVLRIRVYLTQKPLVGGIVPIIRTRKESWCQIFEPNLGTPKSIGSNSWHLQMLK